MDGFSQAIEGLFRLFIQVGGAIAGLLLTLELRLRAALTLYAVPPAMQTGIMLAMALLFILLLVRLFDGLLRGVFVLAVVVFMVHLAMPNPHPANPSPPSVLGRSAGKG